MIEQIKNIIQLQLPNAKIVVTDPYNDGEHFEAIVICSSFNDLSLVNQHKIVMNALKEKFSSSVHALALKTFTPEKWEQQKSNYKGIEI